MLRKLACYIALMLVSTLSTSAFARGHGSEGRVAFGSNIEIPEGQEAGDVACAFCSVHVRGDVSGDIAVFWGTVTVEPGHSIAGDTAIAAGDLRLGENASVHGDVAILGGDTRLGDGATIHGDRVVIPEPLGMLILLSPLIFLALIIWLIVHLVQRGRYRFPVYPQGFPPPPR